MPAISEPSRDRSESRPESPPGAPEEPQSAGSPARGSVTARSTLPRGRTLFGVPTEDLIALALIVAGFTIALTYLGQLRFENFFTSNWDLGINQQMLWTTSHGRLLYETGDAEFYGLDSILLIHSTYLAFVFVPLYASAPTPETLFALQAAAFVASVIPFYLLARSVIRSRILIFITIGLYLTCFGVLSALFFDFHWEAFIPLEFLSFYYLVQRRRYAWSALAATFGIVTLEVFPFLVGAVALLKLFERYREIPPARWRLLRDRQARLQFWILGAMAGAYLALRLIQYLVLPLVVAAPGRSAQVSTGITNPLFQLGFTSSTLNASVIYWVLLLAALGFLPLLSARHLILALPWFFDSVFLNPAFSSAFGDQYALVALTGLLVAFLYGVGRLERSVSHRRHGWALPAIVGLSGIAFVGLAGESSRMLLAGTVPFGLLILICLPVAVLVVWEILPILRRSRSSGTGIAVPPSTPGRSQGRQVAWVGTLLAIFVAFNFVMSPLNPVNFEATPFPGYAFHAQPNPLAGQMSFLTKYIPPNAVVLASDDLFPYVANNPNAWAVPWFPVVPGSPPLHFPFSSSNLPRYVLVDVAGWDFLPTSMIPPLWNSSVYGLVAYIVYESAPGTVYLFELGYQGPPAMRSVGAIPQTYFFSGTNLAVGPSGHLAGSATGRFGVVIESQNVSPATGPETNMWYGPYRTFLAGSYSLDLNLSGGLNPGGSASRPILHLEVGPNYLSSVYERQVYLSDLHGSGWTDIRMSFSLAAPYPLVELRGYLDYARGISNGHVTLNYLELTRSS